MLLSIIPFSCTHAHGRLTQSNNHASFSFTSLYSISNLSQQLTGHRRFARKMFPFYFISLQCSFSSSRSHARLLRVFSTCARAPALWFVKWLTWTQVYTLLGFHLMPIVNLYRFSSLYQFWITSRLHRKQTRRADLWKERIRNHLLARKRLEIC